MHLLQHSSFFFSLLQKKKKLQCNLASQKKKKGEMQCNVSLLYGKNIEEEFVFLVSMQRKDFSFSMCIFYNATFFFSCHAHLLRCKTCYMEEEKKEHTYYFFGFFWLQYFFSLWHAIALLHGIRRKNTHMFLFLATTYAILFFYFFVFLFNSFVFLVAMFLDEPSNDNNGTKVTKRITWNTFPNSTF
jgi:hypothetical protein